MAMNETGKPFGLSLDRREKAVLTGVQFHKVFCFQHVGTQGQNALNMLVNGPGSESTATG